MIGMVEKRTELETQRNTSKFEAENTSLHKTKENASLRVIKTTKGVFELRLLLRYYSVS